MQQLYTARPLSFFPRNDEGAVSGKAVLIPADHPVKVERLGDFEHREVLCSAVQRYYSGKNGWQERVVSAWHSASDLYERHPFNAQADVAVMLTRLVEKVARANELQHSGFALEPEDWSELFALTDEARALLSRLAVR